MRLSVRPWGSLLILLCLVAVPASFGQTPLGSYTGHEVDSTSVTVWADTSGLRLTWYDTDVLRVDLLPGPSTAYDSSLVVTRSPDPHVSFTVSESATDLRVSTTGLTARVAKDSVRLHIQNAAGTTILEEPDEAGFVAAGDERRAQFVLGGGTRFYGTGERGLDLNLRGERFRSYNSQHYGYDRPLPTMNINVPLLLTSDGYALLFDNPYPGTFDLGDREPGEFEYTADGGELSYFVLAGDDVPMQLERYTWLTGRPPMPPKWALGYIQSKYGYRTAADARDVVDELRANDIPADALVLDLYWFNHMGDLSWDTGAFPDPHQMIQDFERRGIKTLVITEPYITEPSQWFSASVQSGAPRVGTTDDGSAYRLQNWWSCGCDAVLSDFTDGPTRQWWKRRYANILDDGVHGLWTDLGEPEAHPSAMDHVGGSAAAVHNVYNLLWTQTAREAFDDQRPNRRFVNLTRSGYAGIQRYGVFTWSADVARTFDGLSVQRPIMLNTSLSGLYYHSSDIGGFTGQTSSELYIRWMQMGAFTPVTRPHGVDNEPTEPWRLSSPTLSVSRRYVNLRYRLLPYLYTMAYRAYDRGMPIIRPLFFAGSGGGLAEEDAAYLFGDSFLVAPVVKANKRQKNVPLPSGSWINYWTDERVQGGQTVTVNAPLDRLPLFVRKGAIVPMRPEAPDYVGHSVVDTMDLAVYPSASGGQFTLYEDDGYTRAYESGAFSTTSFTQKRIRTDTSTTLDVTLGPTQGQFSSRPDNRTYHVLAHQTERPPSSVTVDGQPLPERSSPTALRGHAQGYAYDDGTEILHLRVTTDVTVQRQLLAHFEAGPIPIELATFDARLEDDTVRLTWTTASELDDVRFDVQRRPDPPGTEAPESTAEEWSTIARVGASNTVDGDRTYEVTDESLPYAADSIAYRIKQIDADGTASFSRSIVVRRTVETVQLHPPGPNPVRHAVQVRYALPAGQHGSLRLYDALGRSVSTHPVRESGRHTLSLDVSSLSSGLYFLRLETEETTRTKKITVVR